MRKPGHQINIQIRRGLKFSFSRLRLKTICRTVLNEEQVAGPVEIECVITDDYTIQRLNKQFRNIDQPTDVLSFAFKDMGNDGTSFPQLPDSPEVLGQIIVSFPRAVAQAASHHHSVEREMTLLIVHGMLHLLGYDHQVLSDERKMKQHEKRIMQLLAENQGLT
ncbi:MAG: rRNA maturation RNase YbeY [Dehalococcoidia bacterium]